MTLSPFDDALRRTRARIARAVLSEPTAVVPNLGSVSLRDHQRSGADRVLEMLRKNGGALLADHVGVGKTYAALAVALQYERPIVVAPAALRDVWRAAMHAAGSSASICSIEAMSRGEAPPTHSPDLVIVDEAHHLRTPATRRYEAVASLCRGAHVLLLSATPVQNRRRDLEAQLALFLGSTASTMGAAELAGHIVRRSSVSADVRLPEIDGPHALTAENDDDCLEAIMAIPPPLPAADEGVAAALTLYSLVHLWASSRAALIASLKRRRARAAALSEALRAGRHPTRQELTAWPFDGRSLQLAFPTLVARTEPVAADVATSIDHLERYLEAIEDALASIGGPDPDERRAGVIASLRLEHPDARVVAFSQYVETVQSYARHLWRAGGIAELTARGARIASGPIPRREVLEQFTPRQALSPLTPRSARIDMLVTTDILSEGVDLHGASVVVHLDLPWNPARLEQRVGRLRRLGSPHDRVHVYAMTPPAAAERMLEIEGRLRGKLATAARTVGSIRATLPILSSRHPLAPEADVPESPAELLQSTRDRLASWRDESP
ncbi:MAG TPA: helicase-related protein, partial [Gemmatimonadaceae bacterium]|nr:helicase-related protein [Gemmatimonadaceae bacterium]